MVALDEVTAHYQFSGQSIKIYVHEGAESYLDFDKYKFIGFSDLEITTYKTDDTTTTEATKIIFQESATVHEFYKTRFKAFHDHDFDFESILEEIGVDDDVITEVTQASVAFAVLNSTFSISNFEIEIQNTCTDCYVFRNLMNSDSSLEISDITFTTGIGLFPSTYISSLVMSDIIIDPSNLGYLFNFDFDCTTTENDGSTASLILLSNIYASTSAGSALSSSDHPYLSFKGVDYVGIINCMFDFYVNTTSESVIKFVPGSSESGCTDDDQAGSGQFILMNTEINVYSVPDDSFYDAMSIELVENAYIQVSGLDLNLGGADYTNGVTVQGTSSSTLSISDFTISSARFTESGFMVYETGSIEVEGLIFNSILQADDYIFSKFSFIIISL